ncbi:MAG: hypothetical protein ONB44_06495 [candidate division KSB1 bacterium]|nr:hypothetical protein [candidate division KSB1 bacterium]MDZ7301772.1 hypothetical protein [candidate division KSB1 bacterium]MDZ7311449.1 hypothetical protein [candidate division KSB1 bacterium]
MGKEKDAKKLQLKSFDILPNLDDPEHCGCSQKRKNITQSHEACPGARRGVKGISAAGQEEFLPAAVGTPVKFFCKYSTCKRLILCSGLRTGWIRLMI